MARGRGGRSRYAGWIHCLEAIDQMAHGTSVVFVVDFTLLKGGQCCLCRPQGADRLSARSERGQIHSAIVRRCFGPRATVCLHILLS